MDYSELSKMEVNNKGMLEDLVLYCTYISVLLSSLESQMNGTIPLPSRTYVTLCL